MMDVKKMLIETEGQRVKDKYVKRIEAIVKFFSLLKKNIIIILATF